MKDFLTRIVLATDGSQGATLAALAAVDLSNRTGAELHVLHVWQGNTVAAPVTVLGSDLPRERAIRLLEEQEERIRSGGGEIEGAHLRMGRPAEEIPALAEELDADLVVVGSRGAGAAQRLVKGSVSKDVVRAASRPVLVVRGEWPPSRIVVGDDLSEAAGWASKIAAGIGKLYEAPVLLTMAYLPGKWYINYAAHSRRTRETERKIDRELRGRADALGGALEKKPATEVAPRHPDDVLREASQGGGATLVAVGSRGLGVAKRALLGSVSDSVLKNADGPVIIAPSVDKGSPNDDHAQAHPRHRGRRDVSSRAASPTGSSV